MEDITINPWKYLEDMNFIRFITRFAKVSRRESIIERLWQEDICDEALSSLFTTKGEESE